MLSEIQYLHNLDKSSGCVIGSGTWVSIEFSRTNLANCEAQTGSECSRTTVSRSTAHCSGGRDGWFLIARVVATASRATMNLVALDPTITSESKN